MSSGCLKIKERTDEIIPTGRVYIIIERVLPKQSVLQQALSCLIF